MTRTLLDRRRVLVATIAFGISAASCISVLYAAEFLFSPYRQLPADGMVNGVHYTWGHRVHNNRFGFREREFVTPKPAGVFRVMVLGDSFTWGIGLATHERYTDIAEDVLEEIAPEAGFEVLNFGIPGLATWQERDLLVRWAPSVDPDLIVVGFSANDIQPVDGVSAREAPWQTTPGRLYARTLGLMRAAGLPYLARQARRGWYFGGQRIGLMPSLAEQMRSHLEPTSREWKSFVVALKDIMRVAMDRGQPAPIFAVLNSDLQLPHYVEILRQVEQAARDIGFLSYQHEVEIRAEIGEASTRVNVVDGHPAANLHRVYGAKLVRAIAVSTGITEQF